MGDKRIQGFCERAVELGAKDAKPIDPKTVVTAPWVRLKCQFGCPVYGKSHACPPHSPTPEQTQATLDCYDKAILVHGDGLTSIDGIVVPLEREVFLAGYYKALAFGAGPCQQCRSCDPEKPCNHPFEARPAMEASGIDVYQTARNNGFHIEVVTSREDQGDYYGLVLVE